MRTLGTFIMLTSFVTLFTINGCKRTELPDVAVTENVSFETHIQPITSTTCIKCHSTGTRDYTRYNNAYWARQTILRRVVHERSMPVGVYMSDKDRALFRDWVNQGARR